jgi:MYXO-CTERM domain-containing protein
MGKGVGAVTGAYHALMRTNLLLAFVPALSMSVAACSDEPLGDSVGSQEQQIIGGQTGHAGEFPTTVAIYNGGLCTGTLIAPDLVLTAAHCISPGVIGYSSQQEVTANTQVVLDAENIFNGSGRAIRAAETYPHPDFSLSSLGDNDIGLIRLAQSVTDREPTPINRLHEDAPVGLSVTMVGYGASQVGGGGAGQLFVLPEKKATACANYGVTDSKLLCYSQTDGSGKCEGDSGGPSYAVIGGVQRVVGVTSFGDQSCAQFGADTRVDAELDFLYSVAPELQCQAEGACNEACGIDGLAADPDCPICSRDSECGDDQVCGTDGRCVPAPFTPGGDGSACASNEECGSHICASDSEGGLCTSTCESNEQCLDGFECVGAGETSVCWPAAEQDKGGCSVNGSGKSAPWALVLLGLAFAPLARRKRRGR